MNQPGLRLGHDACLAGFLPVPGGEVAGGRFEPARRVFHPVDAVRVKGVVDGGAPQRAFGHRAGGDGLVEARFSPLRVFPGAAQVPGGASVLTLGGGDRPRGGQRDSRLGERGERVGQPGGAVVQPGDLRLA